jgi:16S rRNA (adenine1518-N6/adenine1519-N6)-dimethyltransferase
MSKVTVKKSLGQHFLRDANIARKIAGYLSDTGYDSVLEIGPGMGMLTGYLVQRQFRDFRMIEIDREAVNYLKNKFPDLTGLIEGDFLGMDIGIAFPGTVALVGNFPYNISTQIMFKVIENRDKIIEVTGMLQKEVAERICAAPGSKTYGILSVLIQAFYDTKYLLTVSEDVFSPPPKVKSGVIQLRRNNIERLGCDEDLFFRVVKAVFNQRRKTLRNSVRAAFRLRSEDYGNFHLRPEQLSVSQFINLTNWIGENRS